jgi:hypothetical protein
MGIANPQKNFNFKLSLGIIDMLQVQSVTPPSTEIGEIMQGSAGMNPDMKTPGKPKVGELVIELVVPVDGNADIWDMFNKVRTLDRAVYCGDGFLYRTDVNGTPSMAFKITNAWLKKVESSKFETLADQAADLKETLTFSVQDYQPA